MATKYIEVEVDDNEDQPIDEVEAVEAVEAEDLEDDLEDDDDNPGDVEFKVLRVNAKLAGYYLERNVSHNRGEKRGKIKKYARDMANGNWLITGDTIKITPDERMIDGGQRMRAVLRAHSEYPEFKSVRMAFAFGIDAKAMVVTDTGAGRTFADTLMIEDAVNRTQVGSIVRRVFQYNGGNLLGLRGSNVQAADPTMTELLDLYRSDAGRFDASAARAVDLRGQKVGNGTAGGVAHYILTEIDKNDAENFFDGLVGGADLPPKSPILVLRNRLIRANVQRSLRGERSDFLTPNEQLWFYFRTWNAYRRDLPMDKLQLPDGRLLTNENFPRPI